MRLTRPIQTRFRCGSLFSLTLPHAVTRWLILQKARRRRQKSAPTACRQTVSGTISLPSSGYFSPFPHGTGSLSVTREYLGLEGGPPRFPPGFTCPAVLRCHTRRHRRFAYGALTLFGRPFHAVLLPRCFVTSVVCGPTTPKALAQLPVCPISPFARHYLGNLV